MKKRMETSQTKKNFHEIIRNLSRPVVLTEGTPWKVILKYAAPIMLSYLLQQIYILTDAIICGQVLPAEAVAGVNDTFPLTFIFLQFAFGCTAGFSVITGKCVGCNDKNGLRKSFVSQIYLSAAISVILTILSILMLPKMLGWIHVTPDNPEVYHAAYIYCLIIFIGIAAQMGYNFICSLLRSYGDSVTPLLFLILSTALNIGLDLLFLLPLSMGPAGAAIATVLAQFLSFLICLVYTFCHYSDLHLKREDFKPDLSSLISHLKQGIPLGLQFSILAVGIIVMQGAVIRFDLMENGLMVPGAPAQNGFGAANKLINFLMSFYNGLGAAILGYNAQNYGKGDYQRIRKGFLQSLLLTFFIFLFCLASGLLLSVNGAYQYVFLSKDKISEASIRFGNTYLYVDFLLYFFLGLLIISRSAVQGIGRSAFVLGAGCAELTTRSLICLFLPGIINKAAINASASTAAFAGVCFGDPGAWIAASTLLLYPSVKYLLQMKYKSIS